MNRWFSRLRRPGRGHLSEWFAIVAHQLLNCTDWLVAGDPHRIAEIEFYYHSSDHPDPFTHFDPIQSHRGRWYFHRSHGAYRGGSFKGIDITFGDRHARGGILIRTIETPGGELVSGPSLVMDYLLSTTKHDRVADLAKSIGQRRVWNRTSPLRLVTGSSGDRALVVCSRVGLSLRRAAPDGHWADFLVRPYRYLTEPRRIKKGKAQMAIAMHRQGHSSETISRTIGCSQSAIARYVSNYAAGYASGRYEEFFGRVLTPCELCRVHGIADRLPVSSSTSSTLRRGNF